MKKFRARVILYPLLNILIIIILIGFLATPDKKTDDFIFASLFMLLFIFVASKSIRELKIFFSNNEKVISEIKEPITQMEFNDLNVDILKTIFSNDNHYEDTLFYDCSVFITNEQKASTSILQRYFGIGYNRAARIIDSLENHEIIGPMNGSNPRKVLVKNIDELIYKITKYQDTRVYAHNDTHNPSLSFTSIYSSNIDNIFVEIAENYIIHNNLQLFLEIVDNLSVVKNFSANDLQADYSLNYNDTNHMINTLKLLNVIDENDNYLEDHEDVEPLIKIALQNNRDVVSVYKLDNLSDGFAFEEFISDLLNKLKYKSNVTQSSNDYGVDVLANKNQIVYAIQCKYYSSTVGNSAIQEIASGMKHYNAHIGVVATNNYFTRQAKELAETNNIILWDRDVILAMINKTNE